jgi:hypothetical protein
MSVASFPRITRNPSAVTVEQALEVAREVRAGRSRSYVQAAHLLAEFLLDLDGLLPTEPEAA